MKHLKLFEEFDWEEYGDKREFVEIIRECIKDVSELKDSIEKVAWKGRNMFSGVYIGSKMQEKGFNRSLANKIWNRVSQLKGRIGPNMAGEFVSVKNDILSRLMGKGKTSLGVSGDTSIIGSLMNLVDEDVKKELKGDQFKKIANEIWDMHPNNPKNKTNESKKYGIGYDDDGNFIGFNDPEYKKRVEENDRKSLQFADRMNEYKKDVIDLREKVIKVKNNVLSKLKNADYEVGSKLENVEKSFDLLINKFDDEPKENKSFFSRFKKKEEPTTKDYGILQLIDMFINKQDIKIFF